jgi:uncharacterized protein YuzE
MRPIRITYYPDGDILYITFGQPTSATGYQLSDQVLLRMDPESQQAAGLTIFNFSMHTGAAQEIPLPTLDGDPELESYLLPVLISPPVTHFLRIAEGKPGIRAILLSPSLREVVVG